MTIRTFPLWIQYPLKITSAHEFTQQSVAASSQLDVDRHQSSMHTMRFSSPCLFFTSHPRTPTNPLHHYETCLCSDRSVLISAPLHTILTSVIGSSSSSSVAAQMKKKKCVAKHKGRAVDDDEEIVLNSSIWTIVVRAHISIHVIQNVILNLCTMYPFRSRLMSLRALERTLSHPSVIPTSCCFSLKLPLPVH